MYFFDKFDYKNFQSIKHIFNTVKRIIDDGWDVFKFKKRCKANINQYTQ